MARVTAANAPITDNDLAYPRRLLAGMDTELTHIADAFYPRAHYQACMWAEQSGLSVEQVAAIVALYSINAAWQANLTMARNALFHGRIVGLVGKGLDVPARVRAILHGAPIEACLTRGSKVRNFQRSMLLLDSCTNDRWSFRAFDRPQGEPWYPWVTRATRILADEAGRDTFTTQSRIWHAIIVDHAARGDRGARDSATMLGIGHIVQRYRAMP
jgi:hypothetical protein